MSTASGDDYLVADPATLLTAADTSAPLAGEAKAPTAQWPFLIVAAVAVFGLGLITTGSLQQGLAGLVAAMALAALLRLVLPTATAGWLGSRSRGADVAGFAVLAVALGTVTLLLG
jgi:Protein of unknown function (DUF3017)